MSARAHLALLAASLLAGVGAPAAAQTPPAELGASHIPAPWWMRDPVIVSLGRVRTELPANRARFAARFSAVERTAAAATEAAAARVRALDEALRAFGPERVRLETTFNTQPLYDQYRTEDGRVVENRRADEIERYEVVANVEVEVRDLAALEPVYARVLAARPTSVEPIDFSLEPGNETKTRLYAEAVADAARRARLAVDAAGGQLGPPRVIDPTARACQTDVLAGWPSYVGGGSLPTDVTLSAAGPPPPPPPAPPAPIIVTGSRRAESTPIQVTLQPPLQELTAQACVVYALD